MTRIQKIRKLAKAVEHMEKALALLSEIGKDPSDHYFLTADVNHYKHEVAELISCDHGEAGMKILSQVLNEKILSGYYQD